MFRRSKWRDVSGTDGDAYTLPAVSHPLPHLATCMVHARQTHLGMARPVSKMRALFSTIHRTVAEKSLIINKNRDFLSRIHVVLRCANTKSVGSIARRCHGDTFRPGIGNVVYAIIGIRTEIKRSIRCLDAIDRSGHDIRPVSQGLNQRKLSGRVFCPMVKRNHFQPVSDQWLAVP